MSDLKELFEEDLEKVTGGEQGAFGDDDRMNFSCSNTYCKNYFMNLWPEGSGGEPNSNTKCVRCNCTIIWRTH